MKKFIFLIVLILFNSIGLKNVEAQSISNSGGEPYRIEWQQINTPEFQVIFEKGIDSIAQNIASLFEHMYFNNDQSIGNNKRKLSILLHNRTTVSNSFVSYAPYRCELFVTGFTQDQTYWAPDDWNFATPVHEYRHALQFSNAQVGIGKYVRWIIGDGGFTGYYRMLIPTWFLEGDATLQETALSEGGRGRSAMFSAEQRAFLLNNTNFSYAKWKNGSYKDATNNIYALGYQMTNYVRNSYGNEAWKKVLDDTYSWEHFSFPLSRNLKSNFGITTKQLYYLSNKDLKERYQIYLDSIETTKSDAIVLDNTPNVPTYYHFPHFIESGNVVAIKASYDQLPRFVEIDSSGNEKHIAYIGKIQSEKYFDVHDDRFIWSANQPSLRRGHVNYMDLFEYNRTTRKTKQLTHNKNYQSPNYSSDGRKIIAVETNSLLQHFLVVLDASTGAIIEKIRVEGYPIYPQWTQDDASIILTIQKDSKSYFSEYLLSEKQFKNLSISTPYSLGKPLPIGKEIYFSASFNGIDNIYRYNVETQKCLPITSVQVGAYQPAISADGKQLIVAEYIGTKGRKLTTIPLTKNTLSQAFEFPASRDLALDSSLFAIQAMQNEGGSIYRKIKTGNYEVSNYKRSANLFNVYSRYITYWPTNFNVGLNSQNVLSTLHLNVNYKYDLSRESGLWSSTISYTGFYPILSAHLNQTFNKSVQIGDARASDPVIRWNEKAAILSVALPFDFSKNRYSRKINLGMNYLFSKVNFGTIEFEDYPMHALQFSFTAENKRYKAYQQLNSRIGQTLLAHYSKSLIDKSNQWYLAGSLLFPGFAKSHSIGLNGSYIQRELGTTNYVFSDYFSTSRGYYSTNYFEEQFKISFNYEHPVWYPDLGIHGLFYVNRLRNKYFFDWSETHHNRLLNPQAYHSAGIETMIDGKLGDLIPFSMGVQSCWLFNVNSDKNPYAFEFIFNLNF